MREAAARGFVEADALELAVWDLGGIGVGLVAAGEIGDELIEEFEREVGHEVRPHAARQQAAHRGMVILEGQAELGVGVINQAADAGIAGGVVDQDLGQRADLDRLACEAGRFAPRVFGVGLRSRCSWAG